MWLQLIVAIVMLVVSYLLTPKPKTQRPTFTMQDGDTPTAEAGKPLPVVFGTVTVKSLNVLWYGEKGSYERDLHGT